MAKYKRFLQSDVNHLIDLYNTEATRRKISNSASYLSGGPKKSEWNNYMSKIESLFTNTSRYTGCSIVTSKTAYTCPTDTYKQIANKSQVATNDTILEQSRFKSILPVSYLNGFEPCSPYQRTTYSTTTCSCECNSHCSCDCDNCYCDNDYCYDYDCSCDGDTYSEYSEYSRYSEYGDAYSRYSDCVCTSLSCDCQGAGA